MLPKSGDPSLPENYRPITCLNHVYKLLSSILSQKISQHIYSKNLISWEQNGCKNKAKGCKENLIIDCIVSKQAKLKKRNLSMAWIDYRKAFDSVPHSWLIQVLNIYKIHPQLYDC